VVWCLQHFRFPSDDRYSADSDGDLDVHTDALESDATRSGTSQDHDVDADYLLVDVLLLPCRSCAVLGSEQRAVDYTAVDDHPQVDCQELIVEGGCIASFEKSPSVGMALTGFFTLSWCMLALYR